MEWKHLEQHQANITVAISIMTMKLDQEKKKVKLDYFKETLWDLIKNFKVK